MRKKSHILLGRYLADQMSEVYSLQQHRKAFCLGNIMPDLRPSFLTTRHEFFGTFSQLQEKMRELIERNPEEDNARVYWRRFGDDDDKIRLNQRKPSKYKGLRRFGPEKNLQRINKFMKERPIFYKNLIQMKENIRFYLRCFYCITKVMILQFNSENRTELARNG